MQNEITPGFTHSVLVDGRDRPWDLKFLPGGELLFTERQAGRLNLYRDGQVSTVAQVNDSAFRSQASEGGLLGLAVDPRFSDNRLLYLCYNSTAGDVRVTRFRLTETMAGLEQRRELVTGVTANPSGRHSGCRLDFGPDGNLWIGTGDAAVGTQPQQPKSLNGKILRIDRDGRAAPGNLGGEFDARIYSYGHRNTQGLTFFRQAQHGAVGLSAEHGPGTDDEVNELRPGNFGWAPGGPPYDESVPMTDRQRFPDAIAAIWSSGTPTQAPSGIAMVYGAPWKGWDGAAAMAMQKDRHLKLLRLDEANRVVKEERVLDGTYGRLRAVTLGPDGNLYVSTDNGDGQDQIVRLTPR